MKKLFTILLCVILATLHAHAQSESYPVSGKVSSPNGEPLAYVSVTLVAKQNASTVHGVASAVNGTFSITVPAGEYLLEASMIGYEKYQSEVNAQTAISLNEIKLVPLSVKIDEVVVSANPIKYNVNGYSLQVAGNAVYQGYDLSEMLNLAPGIQSREGAISVYGKGVSKIYVNDIEVKVSGQELNDYLKNINSQTVKRIDVVLGSGVEEDANAMGGRALKIYTKTRGENGSTLTLGSSVNLQNGKYTYTAPRINYDLRVDKFSTYLRTSLRKSDFQNKFNSETTFSNGSVRSLKSQQTSSSPYELTGMTWGLAYDFDPRHLVGIEALYGQRSASDRSRSLTHLITPGTTTSDVEEVRGDERNETEIESFGLSTNYIYTARNEGKWIFRADGFTRLFIETGEQEFLYSPTPRNQSLRNQARYQREVYTTRVDYSKTYAKKIDFKAGAKYNQFNTKNTTKAEYRVGEEWEINPDYSDLYDYNEQVYAAYAKGEISLGAFFAGVGLRGEYTHINPKSQSRPDESKSKDYFNLFPEATIGYKFDENKGNMLSLQVIRSIRRAPFSALNPYLYPSGPNYYFIGNPYLKPEFMNKIELTAMVSGIVFTTSYVSTKDQIKDVVFTKPGSEILYNQKQNLSSGSEFTTYLQLPIPLLEWWDAELAGGYVYQKVKYDKILTNNTYVVRGNMTFKLPAKFTVNLTGSWYNRALEGNMYVEKPLVFDVRINKSLCNKRLLLSATITDAFNAEGNMRLKVASGDFVQMSHKIGSMQNYTLSANYMFRWGKKIKVSKVEIGNTEEQERARQ